MTGPSSPAAWIVAAARCHPPLLRLMDRPGRARAEAIVARFDPWLTRPMTIAEIGSGTGHVAAALAGRGHRVVAVDIRDYDLVGSCRVLADGAALPFRDGSFEAGCLVTVLHHIPASRHAAVLSETARILRPGGLLFLLEDTYRGSLERGLTQLFDSLVNLEFSGHPHANRTLAEWRGLLCETGLAVASSCEWLQWYGPARIRHGLLVSRRLGSG